MTEGVSQGKPSVEVLPELGDTKNTPELAPLDPRESLIANLIKDIVDPTQKDMMRYAYRHLPSHMRSAGMSEEDITQKLDEIKFPQELR